MGRQVVVAGVEDSEGHVTQGQRLGELEGHARLLELEALEPGNTDTVKPHPSSSVDVGDIYVPVRTLQPLAPHGE